jgi:hypothetical protein
MSCLILLLMRMERRLSRSSNLISSVYVSLCKQLIKKLEVSKCSINEKIGEDLRDLMLKLTRQKTSLLTSLVFNNWNTYSETMKGSLKVKITSWHSLYLKCRKFQHLMKFLLLSKDSKYSKTQRLKILEGSLMKISKFCSSNTEISKTNVILSTVFRNEWTKKSKRLLKSANRLNWKCAESEN